MTQPEVAVRFGPAGKDSCAIQFIARDSPDPLPQKGRSEVAPVFATITPFILDKELNVSLQTLVRDLGCLAVPEAVKNRVVADAGYISFNPG